MTVLRTNILDGTVGTAVAPETADFVTGTMTYVANGKVGTTAAQVAGAVAGYVENNLSAPYLSVWVRLPSLPTSGNTIIQALTPPTALGTIRVNSTGTATLYTGTATAALGTTTTVLTPGEWFGIEHHFDGAGQQTLKLYNAAGTLLETITGAAGVASAATRWRYGHPQTAQQSGPADFDLARFSDAPDGFAPPPPSAVVNAGPDQSAIEPGATVTLTSAGSTTTGLAWTQTLGPTTALSSTSAASPTFTAPPTLTGATLVYRATDVASGVFDEVSVTVLAASRRVKIGGVMAPTYRRVVTN